MQVVCTTSILLPPSDVLLLAEHGVQPSDEVAESGRYVKGFVAWFRKQLAIPPPMYMDQGQIQIMLVNRTGNRRSPNIGDLAEHFKKKSPHAKVWAGDVAELSLSKQIRLVQKTSIFVAVHGAAHALMMFLPPQAVVVEIKPFKFSPGDPFYHGYQNFARICRRSHMLWQNTQAAWSQGEGKHSDTFLPASAILEIADLSLARLRRNVKAWKQRGFLTRDTSYHLDQ